MSTGISMSSVNKIKELAENGDYSLALDIMEHQDLSKSLSPQFIRICGEVYYENEKYSEARAALVRAHSMAPVGNKIIYSIIKLYLSMGLWKLADTYFEIYKFNQNAKDAGTYRIEYMIAKAHGKPVNELYSILISANELETDETWDFEMLLLHAYIRNEEKYKSACAEYRANYRKSPHLYLLDRLMDSETDLERMIYCFPTKEAEDDNPADEETRESERKILEEDNLRLHPKDAKIMIMVEDDTPVPSSMKLKQMWQRSREKKELRRAEREKESEESDSPKPHGLFGRMSHKEEELVDKEIEELKGEGMTREQLLAEVVNKNPDEMPVAENEHEESAESPDLPEKLLTDIEPDMVEISGELSDVERATYNNDEASSDTSKEDMEDSFVLEEEPEEVFMIDPDMLEAAGDVEAYEDIEPDELERATESFDPEFNDSNDGFEPEAAELEPEPVVEAVVDTEENELTYAEVKTEAPESFEAEAEGLQQAETEHEQAVEEVKADNTGSFDFDKAFEALDEFNVESDVSFESDEEIVEAAEEAEQTEEIAEAESVPERAEEIAEEEPEPEQAEEITEEEPEPERAEEIAEEEPKPEQAEEIAEAESVPEQTEEITESESVSEQAEEIAEAESKPESTEEALDEQPEFEPAEENNHTFTRYQSERTMHAEFPVFKSSLFPDYNNEDTGLYDLHEKHDTHNIEEEEAKISQNLQKEEELLGETDRLLARLGIKLNTEFKSILNFDENDEQPDEITEPKEQSGTHETDRPDKPEDKNTFKLKS